jgi:hypothetical protein
VQTEGMPDSPADLARARREIIRDQVEAERRERGDRAADALERLLFDAPELQSRADRDR